jgi:cell division topological specificity factor MinE
MKDETEHSSQETVDRLNTVLVQDRTDLTIQDLPALQEDLLRAFSAYVQIDPASLRLELQVDGRGQHLIAVFSLPPANRRRSIQVD